MFGSFLMFHWVRGIPFEFNAGAYDNLNMWEQIDNGDQYTPTKKFLLCVPIVLFLLSTHYTHYDLTYFTINFLATLGVVIPKLPYVRVFSTVHPVAVSANTAPVASVANRPLLRFARGIMIASLASVFFCYIGVSSAFELDPRSLSSPFCVDLFIRIPCIAFDSRSSDPLLAVANFPCLFWQI